jgi:integrase
MIKTTSFGNRIERNCTVSITLDKRTNRKDVTLFPLAIRFTINRQRYYYHVGGNYSEEDFSAICNIKRSKSDKFEEKKKWQGYLDKASEILSGLGKGHNLTLDMIKVAITGEGPDNEMSFVSVWEDVIRKLKTTGRYSTGESYECALKSFKKILGDSVTGFNIDKTVLERWNVGMQNGIMKNGQLIGQLADSTRGIYLRTCRVIWNECVRRGYLTNVEYPFSNKRGDDQVSIPRGPNRKGEFLDVDRMTELYRVFMEKRYPDTWSSDFRSNVHYSLGLFLAQYLCNGFNLVDEALLTYDDYYFSTKGRAFRFNRKKTAGRSEDGAEVVIPIIEPLKNILDEIAAAPSPGGYVFPEILKGETSDREIRKRTSQENQNVRKRLHILCKDELGWDESISGTWARHSFATNLKNAGVDMQYISESMGHSTQKSVTALYLSSYPLDKQFEYNNKLLNLGAKTTAEDIKNMTKEEMQELLIKMMTK